MRQVRSFIFSPVVVGHNIVFVPENYIVPIDDKIINGIPEKLRATACHLLMHIIKVEFDASLTIL